MLLLALSPTAAHAETPVTLGPAEVSAALFVAGDVTRLSKVPAGTEDLVLEKALQQMYADEPELAPATAEGYIGDMQAALAAPSAPSPASLQLMAGNQRIISILAALLRPYGSPAEQLPAPAKLAVTHLAAVALSGSSNIFAGAEEPKYFEPLADERTNLTFTSFAPASVLRTTRALAGSDRRFGEARDALWGRASEESVFSEWAQLLRESGVLRSEAMEGLREKIEAGHGTITEEPEQLTALFTAGQTRTQEQSCEHAGSEEAIGGESITGVPRLQCSGGALYEAAHVPRKCAEKSACEAELAELQSHAAEQARVIAEERAEMIAAAELLRPSDNKAAALQQATAQAQAQITEEETAWANYEAEKAQKEAIAGGVKEGLEGGTAVLALATGNYSEGIGGLINVGFELYEHTEEGLSNPPPGPQEITLQALANLSTQLAGFQQYTQEAFHAINTQLAQLSSQLARENYELKEQLSQLGERLAREQGTIYALQNEVQTLFAAQTKANLQSTIEDSVGWLARTGEPLSGQRVQEALVALKKYATEIANGALVNNAETQPYSFEGAYRQLTGKTTGEPAGLSEDITYLARFPTEQGWVSTLAPSSLANTTFWSESSRAYAQLMLENASYATAPDIAGLGTLEKEGLTLQKVQRAWSEPSGGAGSSTGNAILDHAVANLQDAAFGRGVDGTSSAESMLGSAAEKSFEAALKAVKTASSLANPTGLKLWGGPEQSFSAGTVAAAEYPALKWKECLPSAGNNGTQQMPEQFIASLPASLIDGVRLGVIGAPGSEDPLILEACRAISRSVSVTKTEERTGEEACGEGYTPETCQDVWENEIISEAQQETVTETLTLKDGETGSVLASPSVGSCSQTGLFWTGVVHGFSRDPSDEQLNGVVEKYQEITTEGFSGRHVGSAFKLTASGDKVGWESNSTPFEGAPCPYEGSEEKTGVEYARYGENARSPLASAEPAIVEHLDARLRDLQSEAYGAALGALQNPPKGNPAESLAGARALLQSFIKLGLPQALDSNIALQSDIEGIGAQFLDPEPGSPRPLPAQLEALIGSWIARLRQASGSALAQLVDRDLIEEVKARSSTWAQEVTEQIRPYIEGKVEGFDTGAKEAVGESSALVESTLNRMQLTRDVLTEARAPSAETLTPGQVGTSAATVRGEVDPNGGAVESCIFEYGATASYGHAVECASIPSETEKAAIVTAQIADWTPEGSFHERVVMKTWGGTSYGQDVKVQLAQSAKAPAGGLLLASTDTSGASIGKFTDEEVPGNVQLPAGVGQIVGMISFTVNVKPGGSARVRIELPSGSAPSALYKLRHDAAGGQEYVQIPSSLYTINANVIELTLLDGGPNDEDGEANGVIVDPLVPVAGTPLSVAAPAAGIPAPSTPTPASGVPATARALSPARRRAHRAVPVCVNRDRVTLPLASYVTLPRGTRIEHSEILLGGRVIARLGGRARAAEVSFAGHRKGSYAVVLVAKLSDGHTLRKTIVFHACAPRAITPRACVSGGEVAVNVGDLKLPRGTQVRRTVILLHGRVVARLGEDAKGAVVSFAGLRNSRYELTLLAGLSNGHTLRRRIVFHSCAAARR